MRLIESAHLLVINLHIFKDLKLAAVVCENLTNPSVTFRVFHKGDLGLLF